MTNNDDPIAVTSDVGAALAAEHYRISGILESAEGKRNPAMAMKLALHSTLDAETARSILADAPAANLYLAAMDKYGSIGIGASPNIVSNDPKAARLAEIEANMTAFNRARGYGKKD